MNDAHDLGYPSLAMGAVDGACIVCGSLDLELFVSTRQVTLHCCSDCHALTALPRPTQQALAGYHDSDAYFDHPYFQQRRGDVERSEQRCRDVLRLVTQACPSFSPAGRRHLDVGCDTGLFLETFARCYGMQPVGIDITARAVALARARGIQAHHGNLAQLDEREFALITLIDVIEHVADPVQLLREVKTRLQHGGVCYVETPNVRSTIYGAGRLVSNLTGGRPAWLCERLFLPEHVQYLSAEGLTLAATAAGLRVASVTRRCLRSADVNVATPARAGVQALQLVDRLLGREILHCAVLIA
jgi:2-polyprenyl-3-methyl-5-hydroxy-6-metoxy-1,4-benzoquinol methylase